MLSIGFVEQFPRPLRAHGACARDHRRHRPPLHEELGGPDLDGIDDGDRADGRPRARPACRGRRCVTSASACGVHTSITRSATSSRRRPAAGSGSADMDCATDVTAMTRIPRAFAPRGHLDGHGGEAARREHHHDVVGPKPEIREDDLGEAWRPLDEHRLALAVRADHLGVERHRQLDDRVEPRIRAVAGEHLLHGDPRVAGPEQVHEPVGGDRVGAPVARGLDRLRLGRRPRGRARRGGLETRSAAVASRSPGRPRVPGPGISSRVTGPGRRARRRPRPTCGRGSRG